MNNVDNWKLLGNPKLPPTIQPFWQYSMDSWSWRPIQYNSFQSMDTPDTLSRDYRESIKPNGPCQGLVTARGGLSETDIQGLINDTLNFPDLKSTTPTSESILSKYMRTLYQKGLVPSQPIY